ncbi:hypothetical protein [Sorangium sp. So ce406]|uniref:hypothetical protein n=1 Tax=Sorangium sp. So ce406 TaxID=3133311 RepID=UPI003F5C2338
MGDLDEAQRRLLAEIDLALEERLERAVPLRLIQLLLLDLGEHHPDIEEPLVEPLAQRADLLGLVVELGDLRLDLLRAARHPDGRARAAGGRRLGGPSPGLGGVLRGVPGRPRRGAAEAELTLGGA